MVNRVDQQLTSAEFSLPKTNQVKPVEKEERQSHTSKQAEDQKTSEEVLTKSEAGIMVESMNQFLKTIDAKIKFVLHDKLEKYYVTVVDNETDEVIREIPSKKLMDIHAAFKEFVGLLIDRKI